MDSALIKLQHAISPPEDLTDCNVNWAVIEDSLQLIFPSYFKEYIEVYGGTNWFDLYCVLYPDPHFPKELYLKQVRSLLTDLDASGIKDEGCTLYPEPGGLFPFITSSDGDCYLWRTEGRDPEQWPIMVWQMPGLFPIQATTIGELFLKTMDEFRDTQPHRVWARARTRE